MKNILILGGGGFIGKNLLNFLSNEFIDTEYSKFITSSSTQTFSDDISNDCKFYNLRLNQVNEIKNLISDNKVSSIIHLVSGLIPSSNIDNFNKELEDVISPSAEIFLYAAKKNIKVVFISSGGTIYKNTPNAHKEVDNLDPINYYGKAKIILEDHLRRLGRSYDLKYVILRPSNVYGNFYNLNSSQGLIPNTISNITNKKPITIWGDGTDKRDYLFVDDLSRAIFSFLNNDGINGEFNVASSSVHSVLDVIKLLEKKLRISANIIFEDRRAVDASCSILDISKIKKTIDFEPLNLELGLNHLIKEVSY
tara:strand:- start:36 stop:962 length:927 start_codon:yes stop_codon:yes gene_type:complete